MPIRFLALAMLALSMAPTATWAAQSYDNCTGFIETLPTTITTQGTWCLRKDLTTSLSSGYAITINTNNVTIDCNDFKIGGLAAGPGTLASGIAAYERQNITVRNCSVRGFFNGIDLFGAAGGGHLVERNRLSGNTGTGIHVEGDGSTIERNWVLDTGGATSGLGGTLLGVAARGSVDVVDNLISGVAAATGTDQWVGGIFVHSGPGAGASIRGNRIRGLVPDGTGRAVGTITSDSTVAIQDNEVMGRDGEIDIAFFCSAGSASIYRDNVVKGFGIVAQNCGDAGGNSVIPVALP